MRDLGAPPGRSSRYDELLTRGRRRQPRVPVACSIPITARSSIRPTWPSAIADVCRQTGQRGARRRPPALHARTILESLAFKYRCRAQGTRSGGRTPASNKVRIVGGGIPQQATESVPPRTRPVVRFWQGPPRRRRSATSRCKWLRPEPAASLARGSSHHQAVVSPPERSNRCTRSSGTFSYRSIPGVPGSRRRRKHRVVAVSSQPQQHLHRQLIEALVGEPAPRRCGRLLAREVARREYLRAYSGSALVSFSSAWISASAFQRCAFSLRIR